MTPNDETPPVRRGRRALRIAILCVIVAAALLLGAMPLLSGRGGR